MTRALEKLPENIEQLFDLEFEIEQFNKTMLPFRVQGFKKGLGLVSRKPIEDLFTTLLFQQLGKKTLEHATLAVGTTKEKLQELLKTAVEEGQSIQQFGKIIRDEFESASKVRSLRIARTELTDTINDGSNEALRKEGYSHKEWSTVIDGRERVDHHKANGQVVGVQDSFRVGDYSARYPGDDNLPPESRINCRCVLVGASLSEDRKRQVGQVFLRLHGALEKNFVLHLRRAFLSQRDRILSRFPA